MSAAAPEEHAKPHGLERLIFFSDAVIAIAITLLALELPVPEGDSFGALVHSFTGEHGREYLAFLLSFVVIGGTWVGHHTLFTSVERADGRLIGWNLAVLAGFILIPWASKTLGESGGGAGVAVYAAVMTYVGATNLVLARHVVKAGLIAEEARRDVLFEHWLRAGIPTAVFALSIPLAYVGRSWAIVAWLVAYVGLAVFLGVRETRRRRG